MIKVSGKLGYDLGAPDNNQGSHRRFANIAVLVVQTTHNEVGILFRTQPTQSRISCGADVSIGVGSQYFEVLDRTDIPRAAEDMGNLLPNIGVVVVGIRK